MKKQRYEISHDIIAEKIWNRLPKRDQILREIQRSIIQRQVDFQRGQGSLLGKTELDRWGAFISLLELNEDQRAYYDQSVLTQEELHKTEVMRQEREKGQITFIKYLGKTIVVLLLFSMVLSMILALSFSFFEPEVSTFTKVLVNVSYVVWAFLLVFVSSKIADFEHANNTTIIRGWFKEDYVVHKR